MSTFGTDGVRGEFGKELTETYAANLAEVAAQILQCKKVVIGRDTRESGSALENAIAEALTRIGVEVQLMGVAPTPAIAFAAHKHGVVAIAITASHNLFQDNGIKIFAAGGLKLSDDQQASIEREMIARDTAVRDGVATNSQIVDEISSGGEKFVAERLNLRPELLQEYCDWIVDLVPRDAFKNLHVALDCANGASSFVAPEAYRRAGAEVVAIFNQPDGWNINDDCGSTHLHHLRAAVLKEGADVGIAHDGDADRCLAIDALGNEIDGDHILTILARGFKARGVLKGDTVVGTVMSNLGFMHAMKDAGITVVTTPVGDRYVLENMIANDYTLGGEQSGHVIMRDLANTGDGILTALQLLQEVVRTGKTLQELAATMVRFPQVLINVKDVAKDKLPQSVVIATAVKAAEERLGDSGRVLLRASGTEALVRVMVEAASDSLAQEVAQQLADVVKSELG
mgnify:CR=1 FL=1